MTCRNCNNSKLGPRDPWGKQRPCTNCQPSETQTLRILLVDDEPELRRLIACLLSETGYEVVEARDGVEGVSLFRHAEARFDVVLSDWNMPRKNGFAMVTEILKLDPNVKVVMMSGDSSNQPPAGVPLLAKPFRQSELLEVLGK